MRSWTSAAAVFAAALACADGIEVRVRQTPGGPMIHVDGKPVPPRFFYGVAHDAATIGHCRDAGVRFISVAPSACWEPPEKGDRWDALDGAFDRIIAVHPEALIVPRVHMNAPRWLLERHPDWNMRFSDGKDRHTGSVSAHEYRELAAKHLEKLVRHLREKYPRNFAGVHPTGQSYGEFFYLESLCSVMHGFEAPVRDAWRKWLAAQGEEGAETAEIPTAAERLSREGGMLRDPVAGRRVVQFSLFEQEELADFVAALAAAARRGGDGKTLVMFFHGYGFEHTTVPNGAAATGDYGSERMLTKAAGNIDLLCAPFSYVNRKYLAPTMTQIAAESALLRGVMPLDEDDTRTYRVSQFNELELAGGWRRPAKEQTLRQLKSNLISCITRGRACWWMDLTGMGWYNDRDLWRVMEELRPLDVEMFARKKLFSPEIAILLDERGMLFAAPGSRVAFDTLVKRARESFERCGAPYGQYFASDAIAGRVPAKLQFFTSTFFADESTREAIAAQRQAQPDITRVWCWAPGWLTNTGRDDANIFKTTGFKARRIAAALPEVRATAAGKALGFPDAWKGLWTVDPLFSVEADDGDTLARWPDGTPAVVVRKEGKGYEVFCGIPALPTKVIAGLAKLAGCQLHAAPDTAYVRAAEGKVFVEPLPAVTWPMETLLTAPRTYDASKYATNGLQVTFFDGLPYKGKATRVFAYYGVPAHAKGKKVPAMVLVHGGGGSAFYRWVKFWNDRGYAAISMDTCGKVSGNTIGNEQFGHYAHDWPGPPGWGSFWSMDDADEDQWVYHAVAAVIRANSFLRALPDVDPDRVGVTGVSWGGLLTCIAASLDNRFKFAAPVYGCGANFTVAPAWTNNCAILGAANVPKWKAKWDPENYLPFSTVPFHWLDGTNDPWFALPAIEGSRNALKSENGATIRISMVHTHGPVSEKAEEIVALADHYLNGAADLPRFGPVTVTNGVASATFTSVPGRAPSRAVLDYTRDDPDENGLWYSRYWQSADATIDGNSVSVDLPARTKAFYLNLETPAGMRSSSRVVNYDTARP